MPFCKQGHEYLKSMIESFPDVCLRWCPCEAHPEPEPGPHSDLLGQAALFAVDAGADMMAFHDAVYSAVLMSRVDIRDIQAIADAVKTIVDSAALARALSSGKYAKALLDMNDYAYEESGVWAIPSYRMEGKKLDSVGGIGVTRQQLEAFLRG